MSKDISFKRSPRNAPRHEIGAQIHCWTILSFSHSDGRRHWYVCRCKCGTIETVRAVDMTRGQKMSCGCLHRERTSEANRTHGRSRTPEYRAWEKMLARCYNPNQVGFHNYGGRGIIVSDEWRKDFVAFFRDVGQKPSPKHSLDRYPNLNGNYEKGNVRWATRYEQDHNRRDTRYLTAHGERHTLDIWSLKCGISIDTIVGRLRAGWTEEDTISVAPFGRPRKDARLITIGNDTLTLPEWSETIWARLLAGWSPERAINTPLRGASNA